MRWKELNYFVNDILFSIFLVDIVVGDIYRIQYDISRHPCMQHVIIRSEQITYISSIYHLFVLGVSNILSNNYIIN